MVPNHIYIHIHIDIDIDIDIHTRLTAPIPPLALPSVASQYLRSAATLSAPANVAVYVR